MNKIDLSYSYCDMPDKDGREGYRNISYKFAIDGSSSTPFHHCLDLYGLVKSTKHDGEFFIFTCTCGEPECANINFGILVTHEGNFIHWKVPNPIQQDSESDYGDEPEKYDEFIFERDSYITTIRDALNQLKNFITSYNGGVHSKIIFGLADFLRAEAVLLLNL